MSASSPSTADTGERAGHDRQRQPDREQAKRQDVLACVAL